VAILTDVQSLATAPVARPIVTARAVIAAVRTIAPSVVIVMYGRLFSGRMRAAVKGGDMRFHLANGAARAKLNCMRAGA
jgi:hypothetical protein